MIRFLALTAEDTAQLDRMATELKQSIPPEQTNNPAKALSVNKTTKVIERVLKDFQTYNKNRKLGYFARVRFLHQLEWRLRDAGYAKPFVDVVLEGVLAATVNSNKVRNQS